MTTRAWKMADGRAGSPLPAATRSPANPGAHGVTRPTLRFWLAGCLLVCVLRLPAFAQSYSIDWYKISGGGGASTGATYQVSGTIGQPEAGGAMSGGQYSLTGGFWSLIAVVQTAGGPTLTITQSGNSVTVSWPVGSGGFALQQNGNVANPAGWSPYGGTFNTANGTNSITLTSPTGTLFFRLKTP